MACKGEPPYGSLLLASPARFYMGLGPLSAGLKVTSSFLSLPCLPHHPTLLVPKSMPPPYLTVGLTGREEGFKCGSKPNDVEEAAWHEALKSHQHGILIGSGRNF